MRSRILLIVLGTFLPGSAYADSCIMKRHVEAQSSDGRYIVRLDRLDLAGAWKGRIEDTKLETVFEANPSGLQAHAHFDAFITDDGERVVVFEPAIDRRPSANLSSLAAISGC